LFWLAGQFLDRTTEVEVWSDGSKLSIRVADSTLTAPVSIHRLDAVEIHAMDSIDPPGGKSITIAEPGGSEFATELPARFRIPRGDILPLGDWYLDEMAGKAVVWQHGLGIGGVFSLHADFRGRFLHDLTLVLRGKPKTSIAFRRGLINNDLFIRDAEGITVATTSIDPTPLADVGAACSLFLRAAAIAALLISVFSLLAMLSGSRPISAVVHRSRAAPWLAVFCAAAAVAVSAWIARGVFEGLPHLPDSVTYLLQARWLLGGSLWGEVAELQNHLNIPFTYVAAGRWLAHYPFGWPLLLAVGLGAGVPWLVAPLLGGILVVLLFLTGKELDGPQLGLGAAVLGVISPLARLMFGSMLSHAAAATLVLAAFWLFLCAHRRRTWPVALGFGATLGCVFGIRPLTALAVAIPFAAILLADLFRQARRVDTCRFLIAATGGGVATTAPTLVINHIVTGNALTFPYSLAKGSMYFLENIPFGLRNLDALVASACSGLFGWGWDLFHGPAVLAAALAFGWIPFLLRRQRPTDWILVAIMASVLVAHLGTRGHGLHGFGARYYFEIFPFVFLVTARGFQELARMGTISIGFERKAPTVAAVCLFLVLNLSAASVLPRRLALYHGYNGVDGSLERQIRKMGVAEAVVLLPADDWRGWAMAAHMMHIKPEVDLLFLQGEPDDQRIIEAAGDRPLLLWRAGSLSTTEPTKDDPR
jgi:hypothetical protein